MKTKRIVFLAIVLGAFLGLVMPLHAQNLPRGRSWNNLKFRIAADIPASASEKFRLAPDQARDRLKQLLKQVGIDYAEPTDKTAPSLRLRVEANDDGRALSWGTVELLFSWSDDQGSITGTAYTVRWDRRRNLRPDLAENLPEAVEEVFGLFRRDYLKANPRPEQ